MNAQKLEEKIDSIFSSFNMNAPGAAVGVFKDGKIFFSKGYGLRNIDTKEPITDETNFRLASVTKQFTAASILILNQNKQLNLDDPIVKYFPCLNRYGNLITIKNLLTHTSGLMDYEDFIPVNQTEQLKDRDVLQILCQNDSLYFPPGTKYKYSNSAYALLALIVEKISGQSFANFLQQNIFSPLMMDKSVAYEKGVSSVSNRAIGYSEIDNEIKFTDQSMTSAVLGDGGIYTSIVDLFKWDQSLYQSNILSKESLELAHTPYTKAESDSIFYGFGWRIDNFMNLPRVYHTGSTCGFSNVYMRFPSKNFSIVVLMNQRDLPALEYGNEIAKFIINNLLKD